LKIIPIDTAIVAMERELETVSTQYTNVTDIQTPHDGIGRAYA